MRVILSWLAKASVRLSGVATLSVLSSKASATTSDKDDPTVRVCLIFIQHYAINSSSS